MNCTAIKRISALFFILFASVSGAQAAAAAQAKTVAAQATVAGSAVKTMSFWERHWITALLYALILNSRSWDAKKVPIASGRVRVRALQGTQIRDEKSFYTSYTFNVKKFFPLLARLIVFDAIFFNVLDKPIHAVVSPFKWVLEKIFFCKHGSPEYCNAGKFSRATGLMVLLGITDLFIRGSAHGLLDHLFNTLGWKMPEESAQQPTVTNQLALPRQQPRAYTVRRPAQGGAQIYARHANGR